MIVTLVDALGLLDFTEKTAVLPFASTVAEVGTTTSGDEDFKATMSPATPAGYSSVMVPEVDAPPTIELSTSVTLDMGDTRRVKVVVNVSEP